jgi:hypothetical protein
MILAISDVLELFIEHTSYLIFQSQFRGEEPHHRDGPKNLPKGPWNMTLARQPRVTRGIFMIGVLESCYQS